MNQHHLDALRLAWREDPYAHAVVPRMWPDALLDRCVAEVHALPEDRWHRFRNGLEVKDALDFRDLDGTTPALLDMRDRLVDLAPTLEAATGIAGLQYSPLGGGVHRIPAGGLLGVHRDFNRDEQGLWRRVNVLVYLQPVWLDDWGGHLELWDATTTAPVVRVRPQRNTTAVFVCGPDSWHGHPEPHTAPVPRLSLAAYYFTEHPPDGTEVPAHSTVFV